MSKAKHGIIIGYPFYGSVDGLAPRYLLTSYLKQSRFSNFGIIDSTDSTSQIRADDGTKDFLWLLN